VPLKRMNFNSRQRIEFVKSLHAAAAAGGGGGEEGEGEGAERERRAKASVTGLGTRPELSDGSFLLWLNEKKKR